MSNFHTRDGVSIRYNDWGHGAPIVLIHGWPLDGEMWEYQSVRLAEAGNRVVTYDRRGFGRSSQPWSGYDYDTLADDLHELMVHLDLKRATLVGFSMGGGEVARLIARHGPSRVAKAVFVSSIVPFMRKTPDNPKGVADGVFNAMLDALRADRPKFLSAFARDFYGVGAVTSPVSAEVLQWTSQVALMGSPRATLECVTAFGFTDFRPDLAHVGVPTLIIHGDSDKTVPVDMGKMAHEVIKGSQLKIYEDAPHGLFATHADRLLDDLKSFV